MSGRPYDQRPRASAEVESLDPAELIDQGIKQIHAEVAVDLLTRLHTKSATFFEETVAKLLAAMGYGGADREAKVTQQSNDGGIDGIIDQDTPSGSTGVHPGQALRT